MVVLGNDSWRSLLTKGYQVTIGKFQWHIFSFITRRSAVPQWPALANSTCSCLNVSFLASNHQLSPPVVTHRVCQGCLLHLYLWDSLACQKQTAHGAGYWSSGSFCRVIISHTAFNSFFHTQPLWRSYSVAETQTCKTLRHSPSLKAANWRTHYF